MKKVFTLLLLFPLLCNSQNLNDLNNIDAQLEKCFDKKGVTVCMGDYYYNLDKFMNYVYKNLLLTFTSAEKKALKVEQLKWLKYRNKKIAEYDKSYLVQGGERDIYWQDCSELIHKRILVLLKKQKYDAESDNH